MWQRGTANVQLRLGQTTTERPSPTEVELVADSDIFSMLQLVASHQVQEIVISEPLKSIRNDGCLFILSALILILFHYFFYGVIQGFLLGTFGFFYRWHWVVLSKSKYSWESLLSIHHYITNRQLNNTLHNDEIFNELICGFSVWKHLPRGSSLNTSVLDCCQLSLVFRTLLFSAPHTGA